MNLDTPIEEIPRIGPQYQKRLKRMGIKNVYSLIFHFPHRYDDFSNLIRVAEATEGGPFSFQVQIVDIKNIVTRYRRMVLTQATIADDSGKMKVVWFNQSYLINTFKKGDWLCLAGKVKAKGNTKYLSSPVYERINSKSLPYRQTDRRNPKQELTHTGGLVPVYPETEGLSSKWLRFIIKPLLMQLDNQIPDPLPEEIRKEQNLLPIQKALWQIHFPSSLEESQKAKKRFSFEELFIISLFVLREKIKLARERAINIPVNLDLIKSFTQSLPFTLTDAQKKASWQILKDMEKERPMNRLLEGDVGSGKTVVAVMAALNTVKTGWKVAFMAPTSILAKQHFEEVSNLLKQFGIKIDILTGKKKLTTNDFDILIGTHALIQDKIKFENLGLVIIDEQHRFGVEQRAHLLKQKGVIPHLLSMTATPIPRTLALTIYGDLDLSVLDEIPKGRKKIITKIVPPAKRQDAYNFIREQVKEGRQVFVICPRIEPPDLQRTVLCKNTENGSLSFSAWQDVKTVKEEYEKLSKIVFPDLKVGMLHGKMPAFPKTTKQNKKSPTEEEKSKEEVMNNFKDGKIDILVSTSVVEVGVDVPNASVMVIEGAEKFGLAQLHQFRGRVGRAEYQSFCFLFSELFATRRLRALVLSNDGFALAEKDLEIRGAGDFSGIRQWGIPDIAMSALKNPKLIEAARQAVKKVLKKDPSLKQHPPLKQRLKNFEQGIHLE